MTLDKRYDEELLKYYLWAIWYPTFFGYFSALVILRAIPKALFRNRKKFAKVFLSLNLSDFYNKLFTLRDVITTIHTFIITLVIAISGLILMYFWGGYNYKRYAHLRRRKFPKDVTKGEIERYFNLPSSTIEKMQNDKIIILEKTIV